MHSLTTPYARVIVGVARGYQMLSFVDEHDITISYGNQMFMLNLSGHCQNLSAIPFYLYCLFWLCFTSSSSHTVCNPLIWKLFHFTDSLLSLLHTKPLLLYFQLPGRTDNEIKNYWNTRYKRHKKARLPIYPEYLVSQASNQDLNFDTPEESHGTKRPNEFPQENILDLNLMLQYFDCRTFSKLVPMGEQVLCPSLLGSNSLSIDAMNTLKRLKFTGCIASDYNASPSFIQISDESDKAGCSTSFNYGMTENQLAPPGNAIISSHPIIDGKPSTSWTTQRPMKMELPSVQYPNYGLSNAWSCDCPSGSPVEQAEADTLIEPPPVSLKSGSISSQITGLDAIVHKGDAIEDPKMSQGVFDVSLPPFSCNQVLQSDAYTMWHSFPSVPLDDEIDGCPLSEIQSSKSPSSKFT
jgi:transcription factor MYB, plant